MSTSTGSSVTSVLFLRRFGLPVSSLSGLSLSLSHGKDIVAVALSLSSLSPSLQISQRHGLASQPKLVDIIAGVPAQYKVLSRSY